MGMLSIFYANAAMEEITLVFMVLLFIACLSKRKYYPNGNQLIHLIFGEMAILLCQIFEWRLLAYFSQEKAETLLFAGYQLLFVMDYALMYFFSVLFYCYLTAHIEMKWEAIGDTRKFPERGLWLRILYGMVITFIFASSLWTGNIFWLGETGYATGSIGYAWMLAASYLCSAGNIWIILKNRKLLDFQEILALLSYIAIPFSMLLPDLVNNSCYSYIGLALAIFIIFLGIDMKQSEQLLKHKAMVARQHEELTLQQQRIMLSQIQPHFMYNTLSVIHYLCGKKPEQAKEAISRFSDYLRMNMDSLQNTHLIPFEKELEHTMNYLWIEQLRFGDILNVRYSILDKDFLIPPLTLQPLVENAVKYGIRGKEEGGTVTISAWKEGNEVQITVSDDGIGFDTSQKPSDERVHVGIQNVTNRLKTLCSGTLRIRSVPGKGTTAIIKMEVQDEASVS